MKFDLIGIGAGPSNLSLAALSENRKDIRSLFFERQKQYAWHEGMLLSGAKLQVSYLKDLVTLVDPTNRHSFLNYLQCHGRLYQFITANFEQIGRHEFNHYLQWVASSLDNIQSGVSVDAVEFKNGSLVVATDQGKTYTARNLSIGIGQTPNIPEFARPYLGSDIYHSSEFTKVNAAFGGKDVVVIGSGQSGAEIFHAIIANDMQLPRNVYSITRSRNFMPIDDSPFANELFTPQYADYFYELPKSDREELLRFQRHASDGISEHTAQDIFRRLYELEHTLKHNVSHHLMPGNAVESITKINEKYEITMYSDVHRHHHKIKADKVVFCTGYVSREPDFLAPVSHLIERDGADWSIAKDYSLNWSGRKECAIFVQNAARKSHGISDPNLSTLAYRNAVIINSILGYDCFSNVAGKTIINWYGNVEAGNASSKTIAAGTHLRGNYRTRL